MIVKNNIATRFTPVVRQVDTCTKAADTCHLAMHMIPDCSSWQDKSASNPKNLT